MDYGIIALAIVPMRAEASERSEMVSQLLFGDTYQITEWQDKWVKIVTAYDAYEGWISRVQVTTVDYEAYFNRQTQSVSITCNPITIWKKQANYSTVYLPACSVMLPESVDAFEQLMAAQEPLTDLITTAKTYLNTPYLWGGRTHFGIDCSGFAQAVFKLHGLFLKRDASQQAEQGRAVDFLQEAQAGDLAFFDNDEGRIVHVGIMLDQEHIIHASGKVKIDRIDNQGIYAEDQKRYTHKLRIIRRYL